MSACGAAALSGGLWPPAWIGKDAPTASARMILKRVWSARLWRSMSAKRCHAQQPPRALLLGVLCDEFSKNTFVNRSRSDLSWFGRSGECRTRITCRRLFSPDSRASTVPPRAPPHTASELAKTQFEPELVFLAPAARMSARQLLGSSAMPQSSSAFSNRASGSTFCPAIIRSHLYI